MIQATISVTGRTMSDIEAGIEEATRNIVLGMTSGHDMNATGEYFLTVTGQEEEGNDVDEG